MSAARPPEGAKAPQGGSDPDAVGERGGDMSAARPPEGAKAPVLGDETRRHWLWGAAGAAALVGTGAAWWWRAKTGASGADLPENLAAAALWRMPWRTPQDQVWEAAPLRGRWVVLNFWATWCPPCVEELPMLNAFHQRQQAQGWSVLGVALDRAEAVRPFLRKMPLDFPVVMGGLDAIEWARALGNPSGALPFTVVLNKQGQIVFRRLGRLHPEHLLQWAAL